MGASSAIPQRAAGAHGHATQHDCAETAWASEPSDTSEAVHTATMVDDNDLADNGDSEASSHDEPLREDAPDAPSVLGSLLHGVSHLAGGWWSSHRPGMLDSWWSRQALIEETSEAGILPLSAEPGSGLSPCGYHASARSAQPAMLSALWTDAHASLPSYASDDKEGLDVGKLRAKAAKTIAERRALQAIANAASACRAAAVAEAKAEMEGHEVTSVELARTMGGAGLRRMESRLSELRRDLAVHMAGDHNDDPVAGLRCSDAAGNGRGHTPSDGRPSARRGGMPLPASIEECRALIDPENDLLNQSLFDRLTRTRAV